MKLPEHDKIKALDGHNQTVGEFLDWLRDEKGYHICEYMERREESEADEWLPEGYYTINTSTERLLAEYFNIDLAVIEQEKRDMLEEMRAANG